MFPYNFLKNLSHLFHLSIFPMKNIKGINRHCVTS